MAEANRYSSQFPESARSPSRILFAGEFSSGKSTCMNVLLRGVYFTSAVVSDRAPLTRFRFNSDHSLASDEDRATDPRFHEGGVGRTVQLTANPTHPGLSAYEFLELQTSAAEGVSDNILSALSDVDHIVWCTIGSQAWRLSEKTTFAAIRRVYSGPTTLAVTRSDLFRSQDDRGKVERRLRHETGGVFDNLVFIGAAGLSDARLSDGVSWRAFGGEDIVNAVGMPAEQTLEVFSPGVTHEEPVEIVLIPEHTEYRAAATEETPPVNAPSDAPNSAVEDETVVAPLLDAGLHEPDPQIEFTSASDDFPVSEISALPGFTSLVIFNRYSGQVLTQVALDDLAAQGHARAVSDLLQSDQDDVPEYAIVTGAGTFLIAVSFGLSGDLVACVRLNRKNAVPEAARRKLNGILK